MKPIRSLLFVPAHREGWAEKAITAGADGLILDLEDSVPAHLKEKGRAMAAETIQRIRAMGSNVGLYVRVNALDTGITGDDIAAVAVPGLDGLFLPKLFGPNDVVGIDALVTHFERHNGVDSGAIELICSLETAESYATCEQIATASPRVATLMAGTARDADVSRSIGFTFTPNGNETLYLRSRALLAARSNGLDHPLVGVWQDLQDPDGARAFSVQNREIGFRGQVLIHPSHIKPANEVFSPSDSEVTFYTDMIKAFEAAEADGRAAVTYQGMHVDYAHIKTARQVLNYARQFENCSD